MQLSAPMPANEVRRMQALRSYDVLDSPSEEMFDRIVYLASRIANAPIALISLVDGDRQWFKAKKGVSVCETDRRVAFCAHAILGTEPLIVPDATLDRRFFDNPLVTGEMGVRAYGGFPLLSPDGFALGTLCVVHKTPTTLNPCQITQLKTLAAITVDTLELRLRLHKN